MIRITLKAARVNAGLTIIKAAKSIGVGKDTLIKWEKNPGMVTPILQKRIAVVYNIPIDYIFFEQSLEFNSNDCSK